MFCSDFFPCLYFSLGSFYWTMLKLIDSFLSSIKSTDEPILNIHMSVVEFWHYFWFFLSFHLSTYTIHLYFCIFYFFKIKALIYWSIILDFPSDNSKNCVITWFWFSLLLCLFRLCFYSCFDFPYNIFCWKLAPLYWGNRNWGT